MSMFNSRLPNIIKTLRLWHGYTQSFVAEKLDVGQQAYSNYERGTRQPDAGSLYTLAGLYHIPMEVFLDPDVAAEERIAYRAGTSDVLPQDPAGLMQFLEDPKNRERVRKLSAPEKELLFYYHQLSPASRQELMEIARLKIRLENLHAEDASPKTGR